LSANAHASGATIRFGLPKQLQPVLVASGRWGRIKAATVCAMTSKYAIALYEMIQLRSGLDRCVETFPIDRFRDLMGVPEDAYERGNDFVRKCLDAASLEVNGLSDYSVQVQVVRKHPKAPITAVTVAWWRKEGDAFRATQQEMQAPKLGRRARLKAAAAEVQASAVPKPARRPKAATGQQLDLVATLATLKDSQASPGAAK